MLRAPNILAAAIIFSVRLSAERIFLDIAVSKESDHVPLFGDEANGRQAAWFGFEAVKSILRATFQTKGTFVKDETFSQPPFDFARAIGDSDGNLQNRQRRRLGCKWVPWKHKASFHGDCTFRIISSADTLDACAYTTLKFHCCIPQSFVNHHLTIS